MKYADWIPGKIVLTVRSIVRVWKDRQDHDVVTLMPMRFDTAKLCYAKHKTLELSEVFYSEGDGSNWNVTELPEQIDAILRANWEAEREAERRFFLAGYSFKSMALEEQSDG